LATSTTLAPTLSSINQLPLHVIAAILAQLDTIRQRYLTILSHRIFLQAFNDSHGSIARSVVANQIPESNLAFDVALLQSTKINPEDGDAVHKVLKSLMAASSNTKGPTLTSLASLSLFDYAFLSQNHAAAESLAQNLAEEVIPVFTARMGLEPPSSGLTTHETRRLVRIFLRYRVMCILFCLDDGENASQSARSRFFSAFALWENEQLFCVHSYLERKVTEGEF